MTPASTRNLARLEEEAFARRGDYDALRFEGVPRPGCGEEVVAFVTLGAEATPEELVAFGKQRLGGYKYPREIHVLPAPPLTPIGKIDRKALRESLTSHEGATT